MRGPMVAAVPERVELMVEGEEEEGVREKALLFYCGTV